jgi:MSHA biogenesis protein MshG
MAWSAETASCVCHHGGIFSPLELQMMAVGEETGNMDEMVEQVAKMYQEEVDYEVSRLSETIEPILLAAMGVLVTILMLGSSCRCGHLGAAARPALSPS